MKRRISVEDLNQLTEEQKQKLRDWWKPADGDWFYGCHGDCKEDECPCSFHRAKEFILSPYIVDSGHYGASLSESPHSKDALPLLDISQMIELLLEKEPRHDFDIDFAHCNFTKEDEICDRLWGEVIKVL